MTETDTTASPWTGLHLHAIGGLLGGLLGALFAAGTTQIIKSILAVVTRQDTWVLVVLPLVGITIAVLLLQLVGHGEGVQRLSDGESPRRVPGRWRLFPRDVARADLTADVVASAGEEERFPWRLAPLRALAIISTVSLGAPMGTEAPAAHLGVAAGAAVGAGAGARSNRWRWLARPAALGGGAAGVAALMGLPLVGFAFMLELGRRRRIAPTPSRVVAAGAGALVGWGINVLFNLDLIRLVVPQVAPGDLAAAIKTALVVGAIAGAFTALTGAAIYRARGWTASPWVRVVLCGAALAATALAIASIARPTAAVGPGGGAVVWAEGPHVTVSALLAVALLRAIATTAAVGAGGCGGVFVPFLAIGDIAGRAFAPGLGVSSDLAGAAGAAGGIAGGYRLPLTAVAMVIGIGGPSGATWTCLATVGVAALAGIGAGSALDSVTRRRLAPHID
jgi:H+/Cl- antiporter ClcA